MSYWTSAVAQRTLVAPAFGSHLLDIECELAVGRIFSLGQLASPTCSVTFQEDGDQIEIEHLSRADIIDLF